ncbi:MAG: endonuclease MutS2 [Balneolales bacterium]
MLLLPENLSAKLGYESILEATLTKAYSPMGAESIKLLKPESRHTEIIRHLEETGEMMRLISQAESMPMDTLDDIRPDLKKARVEGVVLDPETILSIFNIAVTARRISVFFKPRDEQFPNLCKITRELLPLKDLEKQITNILTDQGEVKDTASPTLRDIRRKLSSRKSDLRETLARIMRRAAKNGMMAEQEATIRSGRMVIPLKAEFKRKVSGFIHDVSATGQTVYLEPVEVLNINNEIRELQSDEYREVQILLRGLTDTIRTYQDELYKNTQVIGHLDVLQAKAHLCVTLKANIPRVTGERRINLKKAFNPILLLNRLKSKEAPDVVPLTMELNPDEKGLIITGPNAGGKSVALKTVGICQMMMQSGYGIPAHPDSSLPVFPSLFVDMGDEQSIENDLSTFSSRLYWMKKVLDADPTHGLVLIDEAGSGTDPDEGTVLYQALMEILIRKDARVLVTTHHGALKIFANENSNFVNGSMEFDQRNLNPTYRFQKGIPGSSYAFEIAGRLGVQPSLIERSRQLIGPSKNMLESLIVEMETKSQQTQQLHEDLQKQKTAQEQLRREYEEKNAKLISERNEIREQALKEAQRVMQTANARIEQAVRAASDEKTDKARLKQLRRELDDYKEEVSENLGNIQKVKKSKKSKEPPVVGNTVKMIDSESTGELLEVKGKNATVLMNGLRVRTKYNNLVKVIEKSKKKKKGLKQSGYKLINASGDDGLVHKTKPVLNIRGYRGDEAIKEVTNFIDQAVSTGLKRGEIIHGHGDGILKKLVREYLQTRKEVTNFQPAPLDQGGEGCTIVEL